MHPTTLNLLTLVNMYASDCCFFCRSYDGGYFLAVNRNFLDCPLASWQLDLKKTQEGRVSLASSIDCI